MTNRNVTNNQVLSKFSPKEMNESMPAYFFLKTIANLGLAFLTLNSPLLPVILTTSLLINMSTNSTYVSNNLSDKLNLTQINFLKNADYIYDLQEINLHEYKSRIQNGELEFQKSQNLHLDTTLVDEPGIIGNGLYSIYEVVTGNKRAEQEMCSYSKDLTFDTFNTNTGEVIVIGTDGYNHSIMDLIA